MFGCFQLSGRQQCYYSTTKLFRSLEWKENQVNSKYKFDSQLYDWMMQGLVPALTSGFLGLKAKSNILCKTSIQTSTADAVVCDCYGAGIFLYLLKLTTLPEDSSCFPSDSFVPGSTGRLCPAESDYLLDQGIGSITSDESSVTGTACRSIFFHRYEIVLELQYNPQVSDSDV
jgi:hypothetical protein